MGTVRVDVFQAHHSRRSVLGGMLALSATALGLTALPRLAAAADPLPELGEGTLTTVPANAAVAPGDSLALEGTGFAARPEPDGYLAFIMDDHSVPTDDGQDVHLEITPDEIDADGNFAVTLVVPLNITPGEHWVRVLGGLDGGPAVSRIATFTVAAGEATPVSEPTLTAEATADESGAVSVRLSGTDLEPGASVSATLDGQALELAARPATAPIAVDDAGALSLTATTEPGTLVAGDYEIVVTIQGASEESTIPVSFTVSPFIGLSSTAQGSDTTVTVAALSSGAVVDSITAGDLVLSDASLTADATGIITVESSIPADQPLGVLTVTVTQSAPEATTYTTEIRITPNNTLFGEEQFTSVSASLDAATGQLYQSAYSAKNNALFVTAASRTTSSEIFKLDADTLDVLTSISVAEQEAGVVWAAYGIGLDDTNNLVWVTNTRQNTIAVYSQDDLALVAQLDADLVGHTRDVIVDETLGKVFTSGVNDASVGVFDATEPFAKTDSIDLNAGDPDAGFSPVSLALDPATHTIFTPDISSGRVAMVNGETGDIDFITYDDAISISGSGIAFDPDTNHLLVASQETSNLLIIDIASKSVVSDTPTGGGALNVSWDPQNSIVYVTNRGAGTITVVDGEGTPIANLDGGVNPNHVTTDGKGSVFVVHSDENQGHLVTKWTYSA